MLRDAGDDRVAARGMDESRISRATCWAWRARGTALPTILAFNPLRTFIEVAEPDAAGYGRLTISMLDD